MTAFVILLCVKHYYYIITETVSVLSVVNIIYKYLRRTLTNSEHVVNSESHNP